MASSHLWGKQPPLEAASGQHPAPLGDAEQGNEGKGRIQSLTTAVPEAAQGMEVRPAPAHGATDMGQPARNTCGSALSGHHWVAIGHWHSVPEGSAQGVVSVILRLICLQFAKTEKIGKNKTSFHFMLKRMVIYFLTNWSINWNISVSEEKLIFM